jgi:uncharacterized glyoxalase superfamily protein PhnB
MRKDGKLIFCMLSKDKLCFMLNQRAGDATKQEGFEGIRLYWAPTDIRETRERLKRLGFKVSELEDRDYGQVEFFLTDDDGYSHCFGVPTHTTVEKAPPRPVLTSISAQLFVTDIQKSCNFFNDKLGFGTDFTYGEPPFYAQVSRDNARLALRHMDGPVFVADVRQREDLLSASITVATAAEIEQLFLNYQSKGVQFHQTLKKEPWGARTFIVQDCDDNLILFAGPEK